MPDYLDTKINIYGCVFKKEGEMELISNKVPKKKVLLKTSSNIELHPSFSASVLPGEGQIHVVSDLTGLK